MSKLPKGKHLARIYESQKKIRALRNRHRKELREHLINVYEDTLALDQTEIKQLYNDPFWAKENRKGRRPLIPDNEVVRTGIIFAYGAQTEEDNKAATEKGNAFQLLANRGVKPDEVEKALKGKSYRQLSNEYVASKRGKDTPKGNGSTKSGNTGDTHATQAEGDDADDQYGGDDPKEVKGKQASPAAWAAPKIKGLGKIELNGEPELVEETTPLKKGDRVNFEVEVRNTDSGKPYLKLIKIRIASTKAGKGSERRKIDPRKPKAASQRPSHSSGKPRHSA
jgi:hypothetical protein